MNSELLDQEFSKYKYQIDDYLKELQQLAIDIGASNLQETVSELRSNINEPFLFVVVGEVNAGKSSFINALLGDEICKVNPDPTTNVIQKIEFGKNGKEQKLGKNLIKKYYPADILKSIAIVDSPGTNTVIDNHQEITKEFIPNSDLVFFVFPAKNPHTRSAWELMSYVSDEWRKNVVFILQQKDLTTEVELNTNLSKVKEYASDHKIADPNVFPVSAKLENEGNSESGFKEIEQFIRNKVTGAEKYYLKLSSILNSAENITGKIEGQLKKRQKVLESDKKKVEEIKDTLRSGEKRSQKEIEQLVDRIARNYDKIAKKTYRDFEKGLTLPTLFKRSFKSMWNKDESIQSWLDDLQEKFKNNTEKTIVKVAKDGAEHFIDGIKTLLESLLLKLENMQQNQKKDMKLFSDTIEKRNKIIDDLKSDIKYLSNDEELEKIFRANSINIHEGFAGGGVLAVVGAVIMVATQVTWLDVTGGALTAVGVLGAGVFTMFKRKKLKKEFKKELFDAKERFRDDIQSKLESNFEIIYEKIDRHFLEFYEHVEKEEEKIKPLISRMKTIKEKQYDLSNEVESSF